MAKNKEIAKEYAISTRKRIKPAKVTLAGGVDVIKSKHTGVDKTGKRCDGNSPIRY